MTVAFILEKLKYKWTLAEHSEFSEGYLTAAQLGTGGPCALNAIDARVPLEGGGLAIGETYQIRATGRLYCTSCSKISRKLYSGYCGACLTSKAEADACVMAPDRCHYLNGTCREPSWGLSFCYQPHVVYLSFTGDFKVGITREHQLPTRWFDQGATLAVPLAMTGSRHQAGVIEKALAQHFSDRTQWQRMLSSVNERPEGGLVDHALAQIAQLRGDLGPLDRLNIRVSAPPKAPSAGAVDWIESPTVFHIDYHWATVPERLSSLNLLKQDSVSGKLLGIKGQYLILNSGVFNLRRHEGFEVEWIRL